MAVLDILVNIVGANKVNSLDNSVKKLDASNRNTSSSSDKLSKTISNVAKAAIAYVAIDKLTSSVIGLSRGFVNTTAKFEQFSAVLGTIEGDANKAKESLAWISEFGKTTPFEIAQVTESFVKLKAYGLDPTNGLLRTLGDTAAAMGKDVMQAVEAVADAVVGENERLKEFGIRASVIGEEIKYSWTNASGEMRETVVANNSAIIESTLSAIFNSKYEGAMEVQSKTWNGLISNMMDSWTIFQTSMMEGGVFEYLKAIITVISKNMNEAFGIGVQGSKAFANYVIDSINGVIGAVGFMYDAFNGIELVIKLAANGAIFAMNGLIGAINVVIAGLNTIAEFTGLSFSYVGTFDYLDTSKVLNELIGSVGVKTAEKFVSEVGTVFKDLSNQTVNITAKTDFGNAPTPQELTDYKVEENKLSQESVDIQKEASKTTKEVVESVKDFNTTLKTDNGEDTYSVINSVNDSFNSFNGVADKSSDAIKTVTSELDTFIFKFSNTLYNALKNNIGALNSISTSTSSNAISYSEALTKAIEVQNLLKANPLDVTIGNQFKDAFDTFISASSDFISSSNFGSLSEKKFAEATIRTQTSQFQTSATNTVGVLESMNNLLTSIDNAFSDGILTDAEKMVISGVADTVNSKNEILLGTQGSVYSSLVGVNSSINNQEYYNNNGLATNSSLVGTNSVSDYVQKLMGAGTSGISLDRISSSLPSLSVATGLDVSALSSITSNTSSTNANLSNVYSALGGSSTGGVGLDNLKIKQVTTQNYYPQVYSSLSGWYTDYGTVSGTSTYYTYYDKGGFTGSGTGERDSSGYKQAGIVHEGEYVAPKWMVNSNPEIFRNLEMMRTNGQSYYQGGVAGLNGASIVGSNSSQKTMEQYMFVLIDEMKRMNSLWRRLSQSGTSLAVELVA